MKIPDWYEFGVDEGVLPEPGVEAQRLALWLPGQRDANYQNWERIATPARAPIIVAEGLCAAPATAVRVQQRVRGFFGRLWPRIRDGSWVLPDGEPAEEVGGRQSGLLLVWAAGTSVPLDLAGLRNRWPDATRLQQLGRNLFLVGGVNLPNEGSPSELLSTPEDEPCNLRGPAEQRLQAARQQGDPRRIATALTDLGVVCLRAGDALRAVEFFQEALALIRQLGSREEDVLGNLGMALATLGRFAGALPLLEQELAQARAAKDRFAEKLALDHLGQAAVSAGDSAAALAHIEGALALAQQLGERRDEADLLWFSAILHADLGQRDWALVRGQAAVDLMQKIGKPQARWYAEHLGRYRRAAAEAKLGTPGPPGVLVAGAWPSGETADAQDPSLLRQAVTATKAMAAFVGSGFQTVNAGTRQERLQVCTTCEHHTGLRCRLCGCFTSAKTRFPYERCPIGRWPS